MGKPTGFLEYARQGNPCQPPLERVAYWNEFHPRLGREERQRQGARCMACGVPFCQSGAVLNGMVSGCPLHNLVPEWNDLVYRRKLGRALERLLKTNDFPEFTGRVCPALCEAACTCGLNGQPVTVKDNELGIIEEAWEQGLMSPRPPETRTGRTVAVVGSGPAGLSCAQRLNRRGHSVTVFERADLQKFLKDLSIKINRLLLMNTPKDAIQEALNPWADVDIPTIDNTPLPEILNKVAEEPIVNKNKPFVLISYAWEVEDNVFMNWIQTFAKDLRRRGIDAQIDQFVHQERNFLRKRMSLYNCSVRLHGNRYIGTQ